MTTYPSILMNRITFYTKNQEVYFTPIDHKVREVNTSTQCREVSSSMLPLASGPNIGVNLVCHFILVSAKARYLQKLVFTTFSLQCCVQT